MPPRSPEPLRRITLNLFETDCAAMERRYGHGWTERVRLMMRDHLKRFALPTIDELAPWAEEEDHG